MLANFVIVSASRSSTLRVAPPYQLPRFLAARNSCGMEPQGSVSDPSWSFLDPSMAEEESDVMVHLFGPHQYLNDQDREHPGVGVQPVFWSDHSADNPYYSENANYNAYCWFQGNWSNGTASNNTNFLHSFSNSDDCYLDDVHVSFCIADEQTNQTYMPPFHVTCHRLTETVMSEETGSDFIAQSIEPASALPTDHSLQSMKRGLHHDDSEKPAAEAERDDNQLGNSRKKARASAQVPKKGKNAQSKRQQKSASGSNETDSNADMNAQSSSCYSSEDDDTNATNGAGATISVSKASNPNSKARASRGSATDPQSLYARKRRERINERLRILQNLVPNGTKVDISTMLEEAVQYVKFLQLQIKLLSSDELWMYAPLAYNGMNLGIDLKISAPSPACKKR